LAIVSESTYPAGNETEMRRSNVVIAVMWAVLSLMSDCAFDLLALHQFELRARRFSALVHTQLYESSSQFDRLYMSNNRI
jgi:hypothetical protein